MFFSCCDLEPWAMNLTIYRLGNDNYKCVPNLISWRWAADGGWFRYKTVMPPMLRIRGWFKMHNAYLRSQTNVGRINLNGLVLVLKCNTHPCLKLDTKYTKMVKAILMSEFQCIFGLWLENLWRIFPRNKQKLSHFCFCTLPSNSPWRQWY